MLESGGQKRDLKTLISQEHGMIKDNVLQNHKVDPPRVSKFEGKCRSGDQKIKMPNSNIF